MTYAPDDLKAVQRYAHDQTGQDWASLGITHQSPNGGGYHEGHDLLHQAGRAPEDAGSDYSYTESGRDRGGLTDAGSAFDLGGGFARFREITLGIVAACQRGDPRTRDVREVIYTPDGRTVRRWDRLAKRAGGDDSHLSHTHISFFRDSEGRRANDTNFLGLLRELFEGIKEDDMLDDERKALFEVRDRMAWVDGRVEGIAGLQKPTSGGAKGADLPVVGLLQQIASRLTAVEQKLATVAAGNVDYAAVAVEVGKRIDNG